MGEKEKEEEREKEREKEREQAGEEKEREKAGEQAREEKEREQAGERAREEKEREQAMEEEGEEKSERRSGEDEEGHGVWVAMAFGASQPTLALGRQPPTAMWVRTNAENCLLPALFGRLLRGRHRARQHLPESCLLSAGQVLDQMSQFGLVTLVSFRRLL